MWYQGLHNSDPSAAGIPPEPELFPCVRTEGFIELTDNPIRTGIVRARRWIEG